VGYLSVCISKGGPISDRKKQALEGYFDKAVEVLVETGLIESLDSETIETEKGRALAAKIYREGARLFIDSFPKK
jgi:hypothetical protein